MNNQSNGYTTFTYALMLTSTVVAAFLTFYLLSFSTESFAEGYNKGQEDILEEIEAQILRTDKYILETENLIYTLEQIDNATIVKPLMLRRTLNLLWGNQRAIQDPDE